MSRLYYINKFTFSRRERVRGFSRGAPLRPDRSSPTPILNTQPPFADTPTNPPTTHRWCDMASESKDIPSLFGHHGVTAKREFRHAVRRLHKSVVKFGLKRSRWIKDVFFICDVGSESGKKDVKVSLYEVWGLKDKLILTSRFFFRTEYILELLLFFIVFHTFYTMRYNTLYIIINTINK